MPNPLDCLVDIGPANKYLELLEELITYDDPVAILIRCEEVDEQDNLPSGTTLQQYLESLTNTLGKERP